MWPAFRFYVLLLTVLNVFRGSTLDTNDNERVSFSQTERKIKRNFFNETKKPIIIGIKKALGDVEGITKFLAQLTDGKNTQPKEQYQITNENENNLNLLHISQTEYPQIFNTEYDKKDSQTFDSLYGPLSNIFLESIDPSNIAIELYDPLVNEKTNDVDVAKDLSITSKHLKHELENKYNELLKKNGYFERYISSKKHKLKTQRKGKSKLLMDIFTTTTGRMMNQELNAPDATSGEPIRQFNNISKFDENKFRDTLLRMNGFQTASSMNSGICSIAAVASDVQQTRGPSQVCCTNAELTTTCAYESKGTTDQKAPLNLQILLTLRLNNNGTIDLVPPT